MAHIQSMQDVQLNAYIERHFAFRTLSAAQCQECAFVYEEAMKLAKLIAQVTPDSAERSHAIDHLQEALLWVQKSIAYHK